MTGNSSEVKSSLAAGSIGGRVVSIVLVLLASLAGGLVCGIANVLNGKVDLAPTGTIMGALIGGAVAVVVLYRRGAWD